MNKTIKKAERDTFYTSKENELFDAILKSNKDEPVSVIARILKKEFDNVFPDRIRTHKSFMVRISRLRTQSKEKRKYVRKAEPKISVENRIKPTSTVKLEDINFGNDSKIIRLNIEISMEKLSKIVSMYFSQNI